MGIFLHNSITRGREEIGTRNGLGMRIGYGGEARELVEDSSVGMSPLSTRKSMTSISKHVANKNNLHQRVSYEVQR
jgi:hypothetical protein